MLRTPIFWLITFWGHVWVFGGALLFHALEFGKNPALHDFLDSVNWAVGMVTTVGGSIYPVTLLGKLVSIFMMMGGALFLWSYMAIFVGAFVDPELRSIEHEVTGLQHGVAASEQLIEKLRALTSELERQIPKSARPMRDP